jgi:hypothetical protein
LEIEKYSIGVGDRFGVEGVAQLRALQKARAQGLEIVPVWNKSNREHIIIGTSPDDARSAADAAVKECSWPHSFYLDADHIGPATVDRFLQPCNFFTIDVADHIGQRPDHDVVTAFLKTMEPYKGTLSIPDVLVPIQVTNTLLGEIAQKYLYAIREAGRVYRYIADKKGEKGFIPEVSFDEAANPQTPAELFFILAAIAHEGIPIQTIAPKFTGAFLKGIDYVGDIQQFTREFDENLAVITHAVMTFGLPRNLKLSIHSGSDKFRLYPIIYKAIKEFDAGLHLKTAGTTWLEEIIGLAESGGEALKLAKEIYQVAFKRYDELCRPYLPVINIDKNKLPQPTTVAAWSAKEYVESLQHVQSCERYSVHFRQFIHVSFKVAAEMGTRYRAMLEECRGTIESNVTNNIFDRHIKPLFLGPEVKGQTRGSTNEARMGVV